MAGVQHLRVGDRAVYHMHPDDIGAEAEVIEERGPILVGGGRVVHVRLYRTDTEPIEFSLPEEALTPVTEEDEERFARRPGPRPDRRRVRSRR
jgi:hypothetical protein